MASEIDEFAVFRVDVLSRLDMINTTLFRMESEYLAVKSAVGRLDGGMSTKAALRAELDELKKRVRSLEERLKADA